MTSNMLPVGVARANSPAIDSTEACTRSSPGQARPVTDGKRRAKSVASWHGQSATVGMPSRHAGPSASPGPQPSPVPGRRVATPSGRGAEKHNGRLHAPAWTRRPADPEPPCGRAAPRPWPPALCRTSNPPAAPCAVPAFVPVARLPTSGSLKATFGALSCSRNAGWAAGRAPRCDARTPVTAGEERDYGIGRVSIAPRRPVECEYQLADRTDY
jgi:hypothetical protein